MALNGGPPINSTCEALWGQAVIDDVTVTNDPLCGTDPGVADAGFESGTTVWTASPPTVKSTAQPMSDPAAHGGKSDLWLTVNYRCAPASYDTLIATPPVKAGEGPAVAFWYRLMSGSSVLNVSPPQPTDHVRTRGQWSPDFACLAPMHAGLAQHFKVELVIGTLPCQTVPTATEIAYIDDLSVISTPDCPPM